MIVNSYEGDADEIPEFGKAIADLVRDDERVGFVFVVGKDADDTVDALMMVGGGAGLGDLSFFGGLLVDAGRQLSGVGAGVDAFRDILKAAARANGGDAA